MPRPERGDIFYVMAAVQEYGPHLKSRIDPLITGVGPVEAAIAVTRALTERAAAGALPDFVVSLGSAGSNRLEQTAVYQASEVGWRDMDASALGFPRGLTPFLDLPAVLPLGPFIPHLARATLSTGGNVVSGPAYGAIAADMVDMETYAIKRACMAYDVPLVALRGISDGDRELGRLEDWTATLAVIDARLGEAVDRLEAAAAAGELEWPQTP